MTGMQEDLPPHLISEILAGRCVAFVGAGFSANVPSWADLLRGLAERLPGDERTRAQVEGLVSGEVGGRAFDFEAAGQLVRDAYRKAAVGGEEAFEKNLKDLLDSHMGGNAAMQSRMEQRLGYLRDIPFAAVLTTNYDPNYRGLLPKDNYAEVLRRDQGWWGRSEFGVSQESNKPWAVKLHGDANGDPEVNPVVLAKKDYRRLLYEDARYGTFLRSVFATKTVLFLGVSFTDAYLNEIRSEIVSLLGSNIESTRGKRTPSIGYAVLANRSQDMCDYFREHEGMHVLSYNTDDESHGGFDDWLQRIHSETAPMERLRHLLENQKIVWVDQRQANNASGAALLRSKAKAEIEELGAADELCEEAHSKAALLITHYGYGQGRDPAAFDVLARVNSWSERPPVIVFASAEFAKENREQVLRRGAHEFASDWSELFRLIESLLGR